MKRVAFLCLLVAGLFATDEISVIPPLRTPDKDCYQGEVSGDFIIRWAFQSFCHFVFDPRTDRYVWPTDSHRGVTFDPSKVRSGDIIFVRDAKLFFEKMHPKIQFPYIIVTHGEQNDKMKDFHSIYLDEEKVIAWFGIHPCKSVIAHPKYFPLPIGVIQQPTNYTKRKKLHDYFTSLRKTSEHKYLLYMNFADVGKPERKKVRDLFAHKHYCKRGQRQPFERYLKEMSHCKFTLSPKGLGIDCYRTWEALLVGSIPIVRSSQLDSIYDGLPIVIIDSWDEITEEFLEQKYKEITSKKYDLKRLYMEYWLEKISEVRQRFLQANGIIS